MPRKATKDDIKLIKEWFVKEYSDFKTELNYSNDYELLVAIILSAQCTDKRVNIITPQLFSSYPNINSLANASLNDVKNIIKSCSFFNNKAKNIISMAKEVKENYESKIPIDAAKLVKLAGVGTKTANVFLIEGYGYNLMAVDTHVFRVSHRLGLSYAINVDKTREELTKVLKDDLHIFHQAMVLFGRYICKAVNPLCHECNLSNLCKSKNRFKAN